MSKTRTVIKIEGDDSFDFLQGLVTNDVTKAKQSLVYAALLTPQGKYLADFYIFQSATAWLLDVNSNLADKLLKLLLFYRLRSKVTIEKTDLLVFQGLADKPEGGHTDPRHPALGWRYYSDTPCPHATDNIEWVQIRVKYCIPESLIELIPDNTYILEAGFERLNGVDFKKGCFVGQEVTARMRHKTNLQKGLVRVRIDGEVPVGTEIRSEARPVGYIFTQNNEHAIAQLRFKQVQNGNLTAGGVGVHLEPGFQDFIQNGPEPNP